MPPSEPLPWLLAVARRGHPTISEEELIGIRSLPATAENEKLFDLTLEYRRASVHTRTIVVPAGR